MMLVAMSTGIMARGGMKSQSRDYDNVRFANGKSYLVNEELIIYRNEQIILPCAHMTC